MEQIVKGVAMRNPFVESSPARATVADVMRRPMTTVDLNDHLAAAAYLMKHTAETALIVIDERTDQAVGIITEGDVAGAVADGQDVNDVRVHAAMTTRTAIIDTATSIRAVAEMMTSGHFRHLPVVSPTGLVGMVDINDVCRALMGASSSTTA
jgi:CBS domain-containing protein